MFFRFFTCRRGPGRPWMPSSAMIFAISFLLTMSPCSISSVARMWSRPYVPRAVMDIGDEIGEQQPADLRVGWRSELDVVVRRAVKTDCRTATTF